MEYLKDMIKHELAKNASLPGMGGGSGSSLANNTFSPPKYRSFCFYTTDDKCSVDRYTDIDNVHVLLPSIHDVSINKYITCSDNNISKGFAGYQWIERFIDIRHLLLSEVIK